MYWTIHNWGLSADRFLTTKIYQSEMFKLVQLFYFLMDSHYLNTVFFVIHSTFSQCFRFEKFQLILKSIVIANNLDLIAISLRVIKMSINRSGCGL